MRICPISDFQLDQYGSTELALRNFSGGVHDRFAKIADVVVIAGDLYPPLTKSIEFLAETAKHSRVVYAPGNRDFYGRDVVDEMAAAKELANNAGIDLLQNDTVTIDGVKFIGATLWTDFKLYGEEWAEEAELRFGEITNDVRAIRIGGEMWSTETQKKQFQRSSEFIRREIANTNLQTVVVTHHAPHINSANPEFAGNITQAGWVSDLSELIETGPAPVLWVHGATHHSVDYRIESTRIMSNPHGYGHERNAFNPELIVEL